MGKVAIFVYGTLRRVRCPGQLPENPRHEILEPRAQLSGFQMFDLGRFPGIVPGEGEVWGEVHLIEENELQELDRYEGYCPDREEDSLYLRQEAQVLGSQGQSIPVQIYVFNRGRLERPRTVSKYQWIESGDWFEHRCHYQEEA